MAEFPKSLFEFTRRFSEPKKCFDYMVQIRFPNGVYDIRDGKTPPSSFISTRNLWQFPDGHQQSITVGTIMEQTHMSLTYWFLGAYLMATVTPGVSARQFARQAGISYETAYMLLMKLRAGLVNPFRSKLHGVVEIDETYVGGKASGKRGRGAGSKSIVIGAVEVIDTSDKKIGGRIRMRKISTASSENLYKFILDNIDKGSTIVTDGFKGYLGIEKQGYNHRIVTGESSVEVAKNLIHIHRAFGNLKTFINGTYHGVSPKHIAAYLNEYVFRYNRRRVPFEAFNALLGIGTITESPTYYQLYHSGGRHGWTHPNPKKS